METFMLHLINGISLGAYYAVVAVGLSLVVGVVRLVNFAHGDLFMLGGYFLIFLYVDHHIPYSLSVLIVVIGMGLFGLLFERIVVRPVLDRKWRVQLIATLAASMIISNAAILIWGTTPRSAPTVYSKLILHLGPINIASQRIILIIAAVIGFVLLTLFIQRTKIGKAMRAVSQNREACLVYGISIQKVSSVTMSLSAGLAGLAAALITPLFAVWPAVGSLITLKALASVIMGGFGQTKGVIYAALLLGVVESLFAGYVSFQFRDIAAFLAMILVLLFRPQGLFGRKLGMS
jgi:branched-chain amino acid transport system permease protein